MKKPLLLVAILHVTLCVCFGQTDVKSRVEAHVRAAKQHELERRDAAAAAEITKAIALDPNSATLYLIRAVYSMRPNSGDTSFFKDVETALQLDPYNEEIAFRLLSLLQQFGDPDLCRKVLGATDALVLKHSQSVRAYLTRMRARTCSGDLIGAYNDSLMIEGLSPGNSGIQSLRADLISKFGDSSEAVRLVQTSIEDLQIRVADAGTDDKKREARYLLAGMLRMRARLEERSGDHAAMTADLTRAIGLVPDEVHYSERARAYQRMKRFTEAIADMTTAIAIRPPAEAYRNLHYTLRLTRSEIYADAGKYDEALADLEECLRLYPASKGALEKRIQQIKQKRLP